VVGGLGSVVSRQWSVVGRQSSVVGGRGSCCRSLRPVTFTSRTFPDLYSQPASVVLPATIGEQKRWTTPDVGDEALRAMLSRVKLLTESCR